jgi:hypothetical protein
MTTIDLDALARSYVRLVLAVGRHDPDYVDAYYGPPDVKAGVEKESLSLAAIQAGAAGVLSSLRQGTVGSDDPLVRLRHVYITRQLESLIARVEILSGARLSFDEESRSLYDAVAPELGEEHFQSLLRSMDELLPGAGAIHERFEAFRNRFVIPPDRLDRVFTAAIAESRRRTLRFIPLPSEERFTIEYVRGKSWSGYNWYRGNAESLIQMNVDFPITIDRAIDLASHEGYPGHHVYNSLIEVHLVRERGWMEFSVYALFSPQSLIAEGTANFGIELAFPHEERLAFERETLFPLAGLDPSGVEQYYTIHAAFQRLGYAGNEAARRYLDGSMSREEAARWLREYALMSPDRAMQRTKFFDQYRTYVINYNLGLDMVREYMERRTAGNASLEKRWEEFRALLASPRLPSGLRQG